MAETLEELQRRICHRYGTAFQPPAPRPNVGIALRTMGRIPIHGVRIPVTETVCGWYIYAGDECSESPDFYHPLCLDHLAEHCESALPFLGLPPGWRFLTDGRGYIDVWFDERLLQRDAAEPAAAPDPALRAGPGR